MYSETKRIAKLFSNQYNGIPWTEIRLTDILDGIDADKAAQKPVANANTIWQLVQHILGWRENVLIKMQGKDFQSQDDNYLSMPADTGTNAWNNLLKQLEENEIQWEFFLENMNDEKLNEPYLPANGKFSNYEVIHGLLHHEAYHFGQILMLKKLLQ